MRFLFLMFITLQSNFMYGHSGHAKHNMLVFGTDEIFASHLVYKRPHNYQVILTLNFDQETRAAYLIFRQNRPFALVKFLLDHSDIAKIESMEALTGPLLYEDEAGKNQEILPNISIPRKDFKILYLEELPLAL